MSVHININNSPPDLQACYFGDTEISAIYQGDYELWPGVCQTIDTNGGSRYFDTYGAAADYIASATDLQEVICIKGDIPDRFLYTQDMAATSVSLIIEDSVTSIGSQAFMNCSGFTGSLVIPNSVTSIGSSAFMNCSGFTGSLVIPNSVTSISSEVFYNCSGFTGLTIPDSVTSIGTRAFSTCSGFTGSLVIPNSVTSIGSQAFYRCSGFTGSLVIPDSVISISGQAFQYCSGLSDDLSYTGLSDPDTNENDNQFNNTSITVCKVPYEYTDDEFCGLPIQRDYSGFVFSVSPTSLSFDAVDN